MVVLTSLCPNSSRMVRMLYPASNRWVSNECQNVWHVARLVKPPLLSRCEAPASQGPRTKVGFDLSMYQVDALSQSSGSLCRGGRTR